MHAPILLDHNATTPVDARVLDAARPYLTEHFGNPSSDHGHGRVAREAVAAAREQVADLLGGTPAEVVFTGGGSESDTLAVRGAVLGARPGGGGHVITQVTEHPAVLAACDALARLHGVRVTRLPVDRHGLVDPADLDRALADDTVLVSIMHANNETGTVQPIAELAAIAHAAGSLLHTDASQTAGKLDLRDLGADLVTITGHKLYAPKGVGALLVRDGVAIEPSVYGGGQEGGRRAGTENVPYVVALGAAARIVLDGLADGEPARLRAVRDRLHRELDALLPGRVRLNGHPERRLPNTLNVSIDGVRGPMLLAAVPGVAASTGSACHEGVDAPSGILLAMGLPPDRALGALRLTVGRHTTEDDAAHAATLLADGVARLDTPSAGRRLIDQGAWEW